MIVVSAAFVVVAAVLLAVGIFSPEINLVYASIVVSLLAFAFLGVSVFQRRGEPVTAPAAAPDRNDGPASARSTSPDEQGPVPAVPVADEGEPYADPADPAAEGELYSGPPAPDGTAADDGEPPEGEQVTSARVTDVPLPGTTARRRT